MKPLSEYSKKEQNLIISGGIILFILLYLGVFLFPTWAHINKLYKKIAVKEKEYQQLSSLVSEHRQFRNITPETIDQPILSYLEQKIRGLNLTGKVVYIRPLGEENQQIEMKLEKVTARELVHLLYKLERLPLAINQLNLRDYEQSGLWSVKVIVATR